jgi:threonine dehydrogenase-like Zn-dependent dehydrogenase
MASRTSRSDLRRAVVLLVGCALLAAGCTVGGRHGGPAHVRRFLPELIDLTWNRQIDPGKVFDLSLPLEEAAEGYKAMDERRPIKALLRL